MYYRVDGSDFEPPRPFTPREKAKIAFLSFIVIMYVAGVIYQWAN